MKTVRNAQDARRFRAYYARERLGLGWWCGRRLRIKRSERRYVEHYDVRVARGYRNRCTQDECSGSHYGAKH